MLKHREGEEARLQQNRRDSLVMQYISWSQQLVDTLTYVASGSSFTILPCKERFNALMNAPSAHQASEKSGPVGAALLQRTCSGLNSVNPTLPA